MHQEQIIQEQFSSNGCWTKNQVFSPKKMDGSFHGKTLWTNGLFGVYTILFGNTQIVNSGDWCKHHSSTAGTWPVSSISFLGVVQKAVQIPQNNLDGYNWSTELILGRKNMIQITLPETNIAPTRKPSQKEKCVFQPSIFRCYVNFREGI